MVLGKAGLFPYSHESPAFLSVCVFPGTMWILGGWLPTVGSFVLELLTEVPLVSGSSTPGHCVGEHGTLGQGVTQSHISPSPHVP